MSHDTNLDDPNLSIELWREAWRDLGCAAGDSGFHDLVTRYGETHRRYHTAQHLSECLGLWRTVRTQASRPGEGAIALWVHDAVYDPRRQDNEERRADLAREAAARQNLQRSVMQLGG